MTTSRIKEKISTFVSSQLPEFIQSDFPKFVAFIEAYYRFLEQDQNASELIQNARSYNDIDKTTDAFVQYFLNTYAKNIPQDILSNDRFLVKKIKDLYEAKGSELSFKLLFKLLFNTDVSIRVPYDNVLRASGGNWQQNFSIRVQTLTGDRNNLTNRFITHTSGGVVFTTPIVRTKILTSTLTEIFLDSSLLSSTYTVGDLVQVLEGSTTIFSGTISPTTVGFSVIQSGLGFRVGQLYTINVEGGINTIVKITGVNSTGGITNLKFLNYGYGYSSTIPPGVISTVLDPSKSVSESATFLLSKTQGFGSNGSIFLTDPSSPNNYFLEDYVEATFTFTSQTTFNDDVFNPAPTVQLSQPAEFAILNFSLGALATYPGSYFTDQSFLSEVEVRLQDDKLYQPFAYQTNTDIDIDDFVDIVNKLLNPAGQVLFNNRTLFANIDISAGLVVTPISNTFFEAYDSFEVLDPNILDVDKALEDQQIINEDPEFAFTKFALSNITSITSVDDFNLNKTISDTSNVTDPFVRIVSYNREINDTANAVVLTFNTFSKSINNNESNVSLTETGLLEAQDFFEEAFSPSAYVSELYVGSSFNII